MWFLRSSVPSSGGRKFSHLPRERSLKWCEHGKEVNRWKGDANDASLDAYLRHDCDLPITAGSSSSHEPNSERLLFPNACLGKHIRLNLECHLGSDMPTVDLERLRVMQSYFVPVRREEIAERIFKEISKSLPPVYGMDAWDTDERENCIHFGLCLDYFYVLSKCQSNVSREQLRKLREDYGKLIPQDSLKAMKIARAGQPSDLYVNIVGCENNGCKIDVECNPILYRWISQLYETNVNEVQTQEAAISCERFLRTVFVGGMSGTPLAEKKTAPHKGGTEFLINDVSLRQIYEKLKEMLDNATTEILVFGYIGTIFVKNLQELKQKGVKIKVITGNIKSIRQDDMKKEKEKAMEQLVLTIGKRNISSKPDFHGRAVIVDNRALVGSMDLDSYSMTGARMEFATYTEDPETVRTLRNYFERIFEPWKGEEEKKPQA